MVNVTKFGAFVNILPGRDGLLHISKLGRGKRIDRVEDVLNLGDEVTVRVDDIDNSGKLSLSLAGDEPERRQRRRRPCAAASREPRAAAGAAQRQRPWRSRWPSATASGRHRATDADVASFDEFWDSQAQRRVRRPRSGRGGPPRWRSRRSVAAAVAVASSQWRRRRRR